MLLLLAVENRYKAVIKLLLNVKGINISSKDTEYSQMPLL